VRPLLTIAGHDPVHGAGVTADLATWQAMGLSGASVITALTVQNSQGLQRVEPIDARIVREALQAVLADGEPGAIKIGMLGSSAVAREVSEFIAARRCPVVVDPVLAASNGQPSHSGELLPALRELLRNAGVVTPNLLEAAALGDMACDTVVLKGGHGEGERSIDRIASGDRVALISAPRLPVSAHGTGCVYSAALAGMLAQGWDVFEAACEARLRVQAGIAQAVDVGPGRPNTNPRAVLCSDHLPVLHWTRESEAAQAFPAPSAPLGFYPVVGSADWVERLLAWGARTIQLRIKAGALPEPELRAQIGAAVRAARDFPDAQLFINDHWRAAIELGAYGVHLGQEDLDTSDLDALRRAGLRLGVSSHTPLEMSRAHAVQPSYVALGPVYPTTLKAMRYAPLGLPRLREWTQRYKPRYPVVAIGGITLERAPGVMDCGVDSIAVVSAVTQAADPRAAVEAFGSAITSLRDMRLH
jgi:hydroxymethylpyrimidine kinase / phosphomethylpyrimidine kinase / thiamine-phosphate diphosphorylase